MAAIHTTRSTFGSNGLVGRINATFASVRGMVSSWNDARLTRQSLSALTDRELEDIGLVRGDIDLVATGENRY